MIRIYFIFVSSLLISSCSANQALVSSNTTATAGSAGAPANDSAKLCGCKSSSTEAPKLNSTYEGQIQTEAKNGILHFTLLFEAAVSKKIPGDKNVLFAPISIIGILATLILGAESNSKTEILNLLGFTIGKDLTNKEETVHRVLGQLFGDFKSESENNAAVRTELNQAMFYENGTLIKQKFLELAQKYYKTEVINVNFADSNEATKLINNWASNRTNGRLQKVLESPPSGDTKLILLNTLFFNGEWEQPFFINSTLAAFHGENTTTMVKTMSNFGTIYIHDDFTRNFTVLGLPYKGGDTVMYILLPDKNQNLRTVLSQLTENDLHNIIKNSQKEEEVTYSLPYMNLNEQVELKSTLKSLGVQSIFDPAKANLSRIGDDLFVSEAIHNANLDVTEAGSTGAASTAVNIETKFPKRIIFINRPFCFYIIHRPSGVISFWGTINSPVSQAKSN